jgi:LmbE family N-acetylglucosaminyl deacetylase
MNKHGEHAGQEKRTKRVAVIVAHPDDETLWAGGLLLSHPEWSPFIVALCRGNDPDRAPRFRKALECLGAQGAMGTLDDGPDQFPLSAKRVQEAVMALLPERDYDILLTHAPQGEYTWHRRHGEVSLAVRELWREGELQARSLWQFAYEDGAGAYPPRPQTDSSLHLPLSADVWAMKQRIIAEIYGFDEASWEYRAITQAEAFTCFSEQEIAHPEAEQGRTLSR